MAEFPITGLFIHPVKSLKALSVEQAQVDNLGFAFDRRFMLVDSTGCFITQRKYPALSKVSATFDGRKLNVFSDEFKEESLSFYLDDFVGELSVKVWSDSVNALVLNDERTALISNYLNVDVSLAYMPDSAFRQVDRDFYDSDHAVNFADGFPFLLANKASLKDLNSRLESPVNMGRFRPNIVFSGDQPFQEDQWKRIAIGEVEFAVVKPCSRCIMTCIDDKGFKQKEPLATLATYRKNEFGVCFGQNMVQLNTGRISVGDVLRVLE